MLFSAANSFALLFPGAMIVNSLHPSKASAAIEVTDAGHLMKRREIQSEKARLGMVVQPSGMTTQVMAFSTNASSLI